MQFDGTDTPDDTTEHSTVAPRNRFTAMIDRVARLDRSTIALAAVTLSAFLVRIYAINWDDNNHLHPDERKITMVAMCLGWKSVPPGCPPVANPADPYFFAYGSFPMYLLALVSNGLAKIFAGVHGLPTDGGVFNDYNHVTLVGRALSALFDTGTVLVTGLLVRRLVGHWWGVFAAAFVAFTAFEVQLSHFYAVDTVLTFFITLALFGCIGLALHKPSAKTATAIALGNLPAVRETLAWALLTGLACGLALTSKISAAPIFLPVALALLLRWRRLGLHAFPDIALSAITLVATTVVTFILTMPYAFLDSVDFWHDVNEQSDLAKGILVYPYTIQFANRVPYLDELKNIFIWDMGIPLALAGFLGVAYAAWRIWRRWDDTLIIPLVWIVTYFGITGSFYTKFPRYELPIYPMLAVLAAVLFAALSRWIAATMQPGDAHQRRFRQAIRRMLDGLPHPGGRNLVPLLAPALATLVALCGLGLTLAYLNIYTKPVTRITASNWIYAHIPQGSTITHEVWDDSLPLQTSAGSPYNYHFIDLNLYDPDTTAKATTLSSQLASADVIVLSSARLSKSITRVPDMYPMTSNYYHLLFAGDLGFQLATPPFENHPHLGFFSLPDTEADESYSVYDHPTVWIFTRQHGVRLTADQIDAKLIAGVPLPPLSTASASQKTLLLSQQQINADSANAPLWQRFDPAGWRTKAALPLWWLAIELLGLLAFPLAFIALPGLRDRGWGLAKGLGVLLLSFIIWLPASLGIVPYEEGTVWLALVALAAIAGGIAWRHYHELLAFFRVHWRVVLLTEGITLAAFLIFVAIRSADPDLWQIWRGGEKPMELAFLNGILRSRTLPPLDPWFAGAYINYYYFGQFLIATLIELTGIVPTTAFNLAIPMLFALTISGAVSVVGGISRRWWIGVIAGWFVAAMGNLNGLQQWWTQIQAIQAHMPVPGFDYWASSRIIPYTINEFPFWSFLYADLHAHVIDLPIVMLGLGVAASLLAMPIDTPPRSRYAGLLLAALALGAMACINTWDMPTYGVVIIIALLAAEWRRMQAVAVTTGGGWHSWAEQIRWPLVRRLSLEIIGVVGGAFVLYLPFYLHFQALYGQIGPVSTPTDPVLFITIFGLWLFLDVTFFVLEIRDRWEAGIAAGGNNVLGDSAQRFLALCLAATVALTVLIFAGLKFLLLGLILTGVVLALDGRKTPMQQFTYLVVLVGLGIALMVEMIYLRDFLDMSLWERMNTVFKFYYQVWILLGIGAALTLGQIVQRLAAGFNELNLRFVAPRVATVGTPHPAGLALAGGAALPMANVEASGSTGAAGNAAPEPWPVDDAQASEWPVAEEQVPTRGDVFVEWGLRSAWLITLAVLIFGSSIFIVEGTQARVSDRAAWAAYQHPTNNLPTLPSLDGFAYMTAWYPGDAQAITWMNRNIGGAPVIAEASSDPYQWFGRVSIYTGLPAVLGWSSHESQQRYPDEVALRLPDVTALYTSNDPGVIEPIIQRYHIGYIYVGQLECLYYVMHDQNPTDPSAEDANICAAAHSQLGPLGIFGDMEAQGILHTVYRNPTVTIYQVVG